MPRRSNQARETLLFLAGILAMGFASFGLWLFVLAGITGLIFACLMFLTQWEAADRFWASLITAFILMKVVTFALETVELLGNTKRRGKACPSCGKTLRTELAKQCMHCGFQWRDKDMT